MSLTVTRLKELVNKFTILKMFGHLMGKYYLRMSQEIQLYFIINPDLVSNGHGLHYGKGNIFYLFCLSLGLRGVVFNKEIRGFVFCFQILVFQYLIKRESTFKIVNIFHYYFYHFTIFVSQIHNLLS